MFEYNSTQVINFNTVVLYIFIALAVALLIYYEIRKRVQIHRLKKVWEEDFEIDDVGELGRSAKLISWKKLSDKYVGLRDMRAWLDMYLLNNSDVDYLELQLKQEWCCEDEKGTAKLPCRSRPCSLKAISDGAITATFFEFKFAPQDYISKKESRLLAWAIMDETRHILPFRHYRLEIQRQTRKYKIDNEVPVQWEKKKVNMENYTLHIKK